MSAAVSQELIHTLILIARDRHVISFDEVDRRLPGVLGEPQTLDEVLNALARRGIDVVYGTVEEDEGAG